MRLNPAAICTDFPCGDMPPVFLLLLHWRKRTPDRPGHPAGQGIRRQSERSRRQYAQTDDRSEGRQDCSQRGRQYQCGRTGCLELLRKSPGIMVDKDNNISLSGKKWHQGLCRRTPGTTQWYRSFGLSEDHTVFTDRIDRDHLQSFGPLVTHPGMPALSTSG